MVKGPVIHVASGRDASRAYVVSLLTQAGFSPQVITREEAAAMPPLQRTTVIIDGASGLDVAEVTAWRQASPKSAIVVLAAAGLPPRDIIEAGADEAIPAHLLSPDLLAYAIEATLAKRARGANQTQSIELRARHSSEKAIRDMSRSLINQLFDRFQNPLVPIHVATTMLRRSLSDPALLRQVSTIETNAKRIEALVKSIDLAVRAEDRRRDGTPRMVELAGVVKDILHGEEKHARDRDVRFTTSLATCEVEGDEEGIRAAIHALIKNAVSACGKGGHVHVQLDQHDGTAVLAIKDDGVGFPPEEVHRLFRPFQRPVESPDSTAAGLGLGLFTSRARMEAIGGSMGGQSDGPGKGALFWIRIPLRSSSPRRRRVTLVDMDPATHTLVEDLVQGAPLGATVTTLERRSVTTRTHDPDIEEVVLVDGASLDAPFIGALMAGFPGATFGVLGPSDVDVLPDVFHEILDLDALDLAELFAQASQLSMQSAT